jgi:hypothetical protein
MEEPPPRMEDISTSSLHRATLFNEGITGIGATLDYNFI